MSETLRQGGGQRPRRFVPVKAAEMTAGKRVKRFGLEL